MSIDELIGELQRHKNHHGGGCPVMVTWEGALRDIRPADIYPEDADALWLDHVRMERVLLIDADPATSQEH